MIYLCATMWHETVDEMAKILTSIFRLDKYKPNSSKSHKDNFEFEAHIYFDDAFHLTNPNDNVQKRVLNQYVKNLVCTMEDIYRIFSHEKQSLKDEQEDDDIVKQTIMETPYGGRITYTLPYGNILYVHLKDKQKIRHKKRWSQIMYMYYLLGWKLNKKYMTLSGKFEDEISTTNALKTEKENTYILALDGDTDFQPSALILLVDRLRRYPDVGAACGRIHPTGTGPMVWYQKFEYAVGHWLQKTAEHVLGCVLCSPGCFSLYRAAALMDDNVVKKYTTKATEGQHFVQYDQGAFTFVFNWNGNVALALGVVPPAIYILICYKVKSDTQIIIAAVMSIFYAFLMIATIMSIIEWISNLQEQSFHMMLVVEELDEEEIPFWNDLIELYLKPIEEDKVKQAEIAKELKSLRNKATFLFFIINTLWIVSTFFLQAIGSEIHIKIPKILPNGTFSKSEILTIEPLSFMFLVSFAGLLGIQFLTMLYHRITTFIHFIAYKGTEIKPQQKVGKYHQMYKDHEV
ncbi:hypothetical protein chiPu_0002657 [Chiloscyllium punctatum]|uniref:chitin synthase n=1 Tax=Chiloscyllium punctatum TaxID=137246 RepID=A0A401S1K2_CHIPU|nr:hypothetical protein [Chiloscyllium punctatum]